MQKVMVSLWQCQPRILILVTQKKKIKNNFIQTKAETTKCHQYQLQERLKKLFLMRGNAYRAKSFAILVNLRRHVGLQRWVVSAVLPESENWLTKPSLLSRSSPVLLIQRHWTLGLQTHRHTEMHRHTDIYTQRHTHKYTYT